MICSKCKKTSGDNWSQCEGECPMEMSPHFKATSETKKIHDDK